MRICRPELKAFARLGIWNSASAARCMAYWPAINAVNFSRYQPRLFRYPVSSKRCRAAQEQRLPLKDGIYEIRDARIPEIGVKGQILPPAGKCLKPQRTQRRAKESQKRMKDRISSYPFVPFLLRHFWAECRVLNADCFYSDKTSIALTEG